MNLEKGTSSLKKFQSKYKDNKIFNKFNDIAHILGSL